MNKRKLNIPENQSTSDLLISHALSLITEVGYEAVSLREIARSAGLSHMAPYKHYRDKDALLAAIVVQGFEKLSDRFLDIEQNVLSPEERFAKMGESYIRFGIENPQQFKLMFSGYLRKSDEYPLAKEKSEACFSFLIRLIEYCQFHSYISKGPVHEISSFIWSQIHGFSSLWIEGCFEKVEKDMTKKNMDKFIRQQIAFMIKGIK